MRYRLFWKFLLPYFVLAASAAFCLAWVCGNQLQASLLQQLAIRLNGADLVVAAGLVEDFDRSTDAKLQSRVERVAAATGTRITIIRADGTVLADSSEQVPELPNQLRNVELLRAQNVGFGTDIRFDETQGRIFYAARRIGPPDGLRGFVRTSVPMSTIDEEVSNFRVSIGLWSGILGLVGFCIAAWVSQRVSSPIGELTKAADVAAREGSGIRLPNSGGGDELSRLQQALRRMDEAQAEIISGLKDENQSLKQRGERSAAVLEGMTEGVLAVDPAERILLTNAASVRMLDLPPGDLLGRPLWEVVRNNSIQKVAQSALNGEPSATQEIEMSKQSKIVALRAGRLPGTPCPGVAIVLHDVTELRRLERLRNEFVSNVHHELKTPLAVISACVETILDGAKDNPNDLERFLQRVSDQTDRLSNLIGDLLRLARIESGLDVFDMAKLDVAKLVEDCVREHSEVASAKDVRLEIIPSVDAVRVEVDREGMRTILDNLVDNAINYTPCGGRVWLRWLSENGEAHIEVRDSGIGIPEEHLARVFERFHRVDAARSRAAGGTGLGLAIVKHLVQVFRGRIEVASVVDEGSTFTVHLPQA
ncbi:sensor histidine kinase [Stratiformator vulcanicus]|uniref:histidine kinase n=1 Tax=Stratiformator vulcanicus TaxID=2527980 RepID=A0A517QZT2_9PLAN|nr:ATP-binding protein [Stratiformator vulcanicus]QDT37141.1 Alkaline phosphatase synthesis sensor protein PhoR [Stratiformator vulcanicus]